MVNSGGNEREYIILVENTNEEDLDEYLQALEMEGWYTDWDAAKNENIRLSFQFNSESMLQIIVRVEEQGSWPKDKIPSEIVPPEKGTLFGEVYIGDNGSEDYEAYNITFEYSGLTEEDIKEYMQKYIDNGWDGDEYFVSKIINWKEKQFKASIEPMGSEGNVYFNCNLGERK